MRNFLLFVIVFFLTFSAPVFADITTNCTLDATTQTCCMSNQCTKTLYSGDMNYLTNGTYVPINTAIALDNSNGFNYSMTHSNYQAFFKNDSDSSRSVRFQKDNYTFEFDIATSQAQWYNSNTRAIMGNVLNPQHTIAGINDNSVTYANAWSGVNLTYTANNMQLKESLDISSIPGNASYADFFRYRINVYYNNSLQVCVNGVCYLHPTSVTVNTTDAVYFKDSNNATVYYLPVPTVTDSNGTTALATYFFSLNNGIDLWYLGIPKAFIDNATSYGTFPIQLDPTITLNESNGGNVGDAEVDSNHVTYNYGAYQYIHAGFDGGVITRTFILWNLSVVPAGSTITNANMSLLSWGGTSGGWLLAYNTSLYNSTGAGPWVEGGAGTSGGACGTRCDLTQNITYNNQPSVGILQDNKTSTIGARDYFNITNAAIYTYGLANMNMSILIKGNTETGSANNLNFYAKETATVAFRPQLVVTYTTGGDSTPPTFSSPSINTTLAGRTVNISIKISDETALSGYIFSTNNTGTWVNTTWTSLTSGQLATNITTLNATGSTVVNYTWYANDSSNNWATNINSTTTTLQNLSQNDYDLTTNAETNQNLKELTRNMLESTSSTDALKQPRELLRALLDYSTDVDNLQSLRELLRSLNDATQSSDLSSLTKELIRYLYDASLNADNAQQLKELIRNMNDLTTNYDLNSTSRELIRNLYDLTSGTDNLQQLRELIRNYYDITANSETNSNTKELARFVYDYSQSADTSQQLKELLRLFYDASNNSDLSQQGRELLRSFYDLTTGNDTLNYTTETVSGLKNIIAFFYDVTMSTDTTGFYKEFVRNIYDQSQASDSLDRQRELLRQLLDYTNNSDASNNLREVSVILYDLTTDIDQFEGWLTCLIGVNCPATSGNIIITNGGGGGCPASADPTNTTHSCVRLVNCAWKCYKVSEMTPMDALAFTLNKGIVLPAEMFVSTNKLPLLVMPVVAVIILVYKRRKKKTRQVPMSELPGLP